MLNFLDSAGMVRSLLDQYNNNVNRLDMMHKRYLNMTATEDIEHLNSQISILTQENSSLGSEIREKLRKMGHDCYGNNTKIGQTESLSSDFKRAIQNYQQIERDFNSKNKLKIKRQLQIINPEQTDEEIEEYLASNNQQQQAVFADAVLNGSSTTREDARSALAQVQNRHQEIQQISRTLVELSELFQNMETLIINQDPIVRNIEETAYTAQQDIEAGIVHTDKAITSTRSWRKYRWWCTGICVIVVIIVVLIILKATGVI